MNEGKNFSLLYYTISFLGLILWMVSSTMLRELSWNPFLWTVSGFMFIVPMFMIGRNVKYVEIQSGKDSYAWILSVALLIVSGVLIYLEMMEVFAENVHLAEGSDVIPSLEVYVQRFLSGEKVYVEIPFSNYEVKPTYFPAMWMPYIVPEVLNFDYRLMAVGSFFLLYAGITIYHIKKYPSYLHALLTAIVPFLKLVFYSRCISICFCNGVNAACFLYVIDFGFNPKKMAFNGNCYRIVHNV